MIVSGVAAVAISIAVPLAFLALVRRLDLYASGHFGIVLRCFLWGFVAFVASFATNTLALTWFSIVAVRTAVAPVVEELFKAAPLVYYVRRPDFTYFVDGAIYGFAAGTGFAVLENLFYITTVGSDAGLALSINRAFSTSLMHGTTSALVGVSLGRLRFGRGLARLAALVFGLAMAMALHLTFNNWLVAARTFNLNVLAGAILLGLGGVAAIALIILQGLREERRWLRDTLKLDVGVSAHEAAVVQELANLDALLAPVEQHFGREKRRQVEEFLRLQARLGLKRKAEQMTPELALRQELAAQIAVLQRQIDHLRREVGVYCMMYVRQILPAAEEPLWARLELGLAETPTTEHNVWGLMGDRLGRQPPDPER
jgi:RsiW-degrading membrane proteinase PrsW (M82 family)